MHIWHGILPRFNNHAKWAFKKFVGAEEYKILQGTLNPKDPFVAMKLRTGKKFKIILLDDSRRRI